MFRERVRKNNRLVICKVSEVKELPTKLQFEKEYGSRGSHLNLLQFTIFPRINNEFPSARNEMRYDCRDRCCWWVSRGRGVLNGRVNNEGEGGFASESCDES